MQSSDSEIEIGMLTRSKGPVEDIENTAEPREHNYKKQTVDSTPKSRVWDGFSVGMNFVNPHDSNKLLGKDLQLTIFAR